MTLNLTRRSVKGQPLDAVDHDSNLDKIETGVLARPTTAAQTEAITAAVTAHEAAADPHPGYLTAAEGDAAYVGLSDARLSDAREWTAATIEQAEAEAGTATTRRAFTAQRVRQAIAAWWTGASTAAGRAMVEALDDVAQRTLLGLGTADSPTFAGLTITGAAPVVIPHIHGSIAGNFYVHVRNTSGGTLAAGTAVYATGSVGDTDRITVAACDPTDPLKMPAIAVLETTLAQNGDGDAVILGELMPFNTGGYQIRDRLYVGAGGALVATPPASGLVQAVGSVARVNAQTGTILVGIGAAMARVGFTGAYGDLSGLPTLGTAAAANTGDFATAAQGAKADTAVQPGALGNSAGLNVGTTTGTVAAGDDSRITGALSATAAAAAYQPLDSDLTAIAALSTTAFGRDMLTQADAAATRTTIGAGTSNVAISSATPQPLGTAAAGATGQAADAGHVHASPPLVSTSSAGLQAPTGFGTIAYAATVDLDLAVQHGRVDTITLTGPLTFTTSNLANGLVTGLRLIPGASARDLTFPADWKFVSAKPASLPADKIARLTIEVHGTTNADVVAAIAIQP